MRTRALCYLGALLAPLVVVSVYLVFSRWPDSWGTASSDYLALALAILAGLFALWALPIKMLQRAIVSVIYVPVMGTLLTFWALWFVCIVFGNCL